MGEFGSYLVGTLLDIRDFALMPYWWVRNGLRPKIDLTDMTGEQRRRYYDLGDPDGEYADDDPRKYGYYCMGTSGYLGPRDYPFREKDFHQRSKRGSLSHPAHHWEPHKLTSSGYAFVKNPEELSSSYIPARKSLFRRPSKRPDPSG